MASPRRLEVQRLAEVNDWLTQCRDTLETNFARLDDLLERMPRAAHPPRRVRRHAGANQFKPKD